MVDGLASSCAGASQRPGPTALFQDPGWREAEEMTRGWIRYVLAAGVVLGASLAGCGDDDTATTATTAEETSSTAEEVTSSTTTTSAPTITTTTTATTAPLPESELPGTAFDLAPAAGAVLSVIGVRYDDVLHVRYAPGTDQAVVADLAPVAEDFVATGRARALTQSVWWEVTTADGTNGWVVARFTARHGPTFDVTSEVIAKLGDAPSAETMLDLGEIVADALKSVDPEITPVIVPVVAPSVGGLGEVTYDVVGFADDSMRALRVHVFGQPDDRGDRFTLKSAEATDMCDSVRGGAGTFDGPCP
ncbi:MAG: hypothetical protein OEY41_18085 [Acidimicrobiia bacterium]|nr:hypothetical protein [Acidimicrobiia bacterium]